MRLYFSLKWRVAAKIVHFFSIWHFDVAKSILLARKNRLLTRHYIFFVKNMSMPFVIRNKVSILAADNKKTMERQRIHLQYSLNATSKTLLWNAISTPSGLEDWFADRVQSDDKTVTFYWGKTESRSAIIIAVRAYSFIRFRWTDGNNDREYFEIRMTNSELTNDFTLEITDFADADDVDDSCELWNSEVETLRRKCGF